MTVLAVTVGPVMYIILVKSFPPSSVNVTVAGFVEREAFSVARVLSRNST